MDEFSFKDIESRLMKVILADKWIPVKAGVDYDQTDIDGRDGAVYTIKRMLPVSKTLKAYLLDEDLIHDVAAWLSGDGIFRIGNRYTNGRIFDQIEFTKHGIGKMQFDIPIIFDPYWYSVDEWEVVEEKVRNKGNVSATPLIRVTGSGDCSIAIGSVSIDIAFGDIQQTIEIDCQEKNESRPDLVSIGWEYPVLQPGVNFITVTGNCIVEMKRRGRWNVG